MTNAEAIAAYEDAMRSAGVSPRDLQPVLGLSRASQYRIMSGARATTAHTIAAMRMATKFLLWLQKSAMLTDSLPDARSRATRLHEAFEIWLQQD